MCQNYSMELSDFNSYSFLHLVQCIFLMYSAFVILLKQIAVLDHVNTTTTTTATFTTTTSCTSWQRGSYLNDLSSAGNAFLYDCLGDKSVILRNKIPLFESKCWTFLGILSKTLFRISGYEVLCCEMFKSETFFAQDTSTFLIKPLASTPCPAIGARCASVRGRLIMQRDFSRLHFGCFIHLLPFKE